MSSDATDVGRDLARAQGLLELKRFDDAGSLLERLLGREPDNPLAWGLLAQAKLGADDPRDALEAAERAAALAPDDDWPHRLRSIALQQLGDDEGAISAAREAVAAGPHTWQAYSRLAIALGVAKRDLDEALASAELGVELGPHVPAAHYALGVVHDRRGDHAEAERCFRQALELDPQHTPSHNALAARQLAASRGRPGNLAAAASGFRDAVRADPRSGVSGRNLELVIRHFLARVSYLVFIIVWLASGVGGGTAADRIGPLLLLLIPAAFAARFLAALAPDLRRQVWYMAFHGPLAPPMIAQASAVGLLFVSAAAPSGARAGFSGAAVLASLIARFLIVRRTGIGRVLSAHGARIILAAVALVILFLVGTTVGGGFDPSRGLAVVILGAALGVVGYRLKQRRASFR